MNGKFSKSSISTHSNIQHKLAIIILTWNNLDDTAECIHSINKLNYQNYNVILVDNGSTDDSIAKLRSMFPNVFIIENKQNLGYAGGNNVGIQYALSQEAEHILVLNNDTIVAENLASELLKMNKQCQSLGILGCANYYYNDKSRIQFSGGVIDWKRGNIIDPTRHKIDRGQFHRIREVDTVVGSCLFIPAKVIREVGTFDPRYFLTFEESDLCCRVRKAGYKVYTCMRAKIWHKVSVSGKSQNQGHNILKYYSVRNRFLFLTKNSPKSYLLISYPYHIGRTIFQILRELIQGNSSRAKWLLIALIQGIFGRYGRGSFV